MKIGIKRQKCRKSEEEEEEKRQINERMKKREKW